MRRHSELISRRAAIIAAATALLHDFATAQEPKGTFRFVAKVDADGLFNSTLKSVLTQGVQQDLPAALAGITAGDTVFEVDGTPVADAKAQALATSSCVLLTRGHNGKLHNAARSVSRLAAMRRLMALTHSSRIITDHPIRSTSDSGLRAIQVTRQSLD